MTILEKKQMKEILWELIQENKDFFKSLLKEIIVEQSNIDSEDLEERKRKIEEIIKKDFQRYDKVFKALA